MQNQGIISYIFPHFGLKAQPLGKAFARNCRAFCFIRHFTVLFQGYIGATALREKF